MIMSAQDARGPKEHEMTRHWRGCEETGGGRQEVLIR
jgi:hypothetical protein